jgi:4'-phosphopantetheinyl transferase
MTNGIDLWLVDLDRAEAALEALEARAPRLSPDIRARCDAMHDEAARRERRLSHIALRLALEARLGEVVRGVPFATSETGKPSLAHPDPAESGLGFSLAHTRGLALIAVGGGTLGVDIERVRAVRIPAARRPPIEAEAVVLAAGAPLIDTDADARFINAWVRVEAVAKATGSGVAPILERLRPGKPADAGPPAQAAGREQGLVARDVPIAGGIFAAIALDRAAPLPALGGFPETAGAIEALLAARLAASGRTRR